MKKTLDKNTQILTRRFLTGEDAYVTGYFFATIDSIPLDFLKFLREKYTGDWTEERITQLFTGSVLEVALPQETLKTVTFPGKAAYFRTAPLFSQKGNSISINFLVTQTLNISSFFIAWYQYISQITDGRWKIDSENPSTNIYGANFYYAAFLPNMIDIVFAFVGEGFYPTNNPFSEFGHALGTIENLRHTVTFNVDYYDVWTRSNRDNVWIKDLIMSKYEKYKITFSEQSEEVKEAKEKGTTAKDKYTIYYV